MTIGDVCTRDVVKVRRNETVLDAARLMRDRHVGTVVVVDDDNGSRRPIGILTDRDIVVGIVAQAPDKIADLLVDDVRTSELVTVTTTDRVETALGRMRESGVRRLPVIGADGWLAGIVTFDDLLAVMALELSELAAIVERGRRREAALRA